MKLFSFILQYSEGTFISQVEAENKEKAMRKWLREIDITQYPNFSQEERKRLIEEDFEDEDPILIQGCKNIWCFGMRINGELAFINFIQTDNL